MTGPSLSPDSVLRRSPVYRELQRLGAVFEALGDGAVAVTVGATAAAEAERARALGLCDLSVLPRAGYKGWAAIDWGRRQGLGIGERNNLAYPQADGALVARLADSEFLVLGPGGRAGATVARLA
ncbi:MAG: sarcosine oxidase, partial [Alphaproteobacteria bacterium]|nr:sarcosine oxidase [Alphaproteobacteria bacterium]